MSERAFASLTPANALARLAFSDVYGVLTSGRQNNQPDDALRRMAVEPQQTFDGEILRLRFETKKRASRNAYATDGESSESLTEPDTDTEQTYQELGMIWKGRYLLRLEPLPSVPFMGWAAGKGPLENTPMDLLLCTRPFAKLHGINLRNPHARFNFTLTNRGFYIIGCSRSPSAQLTVNGETATRRPYHLNQHRMKIQLEKFEYDFQWTEFAANEAFKEERHRYVTRTLGGPEFVAIDAPTPLPNRRTMGNWTLGEALGAGGRERVFFASDSSGDVAAIKMLERTSRNYHSVDEEIKTLQSVTDLVDQSDNSERLLRMVEVIYSNGEKFSSKMVFDNVAIVLRPMMPRTFVDLVGIRSKG